MSIITPDTSLSVDEAVEQLRGSDLSKRYYAAWYLGFLGNPQGTEALIEALFDESDRTELGGYPLRRKAAESLGRIGDDRAVPALIESLGCEDFYVREQAAWALARIGDTRAAGPLVALLVQGGKQPYDMIVESLGDLRVTEAEPHIRPFLTDPGERVRCAAARALFHLTGEVALLDVLLSGLASADVHIRRSALFDLAETGHLESAAAIAGAQLTPNLKLFALKQLVDACDEEEAAAPVLQWIDALL
jgi:HEAT repeat protein